MCIYHIDVRPLASGRSGAVSGEVRGSCLWCRVSGGSRTDGSTGRLRCIWDLLLPLVVVSS
jgi:hypothetical protein